MKFKALRTEEQSSTFTNTLQEIDYTTLDPQKVIIRVAYSGINYKDLLSASGNKGITRNYPHTPGIDASGWIEKDPTGTFAPGTEVVVMGYDLGMNTDGAFAEYIAVPVEWVLLKPSTFTLKQVMEIGTSGFTAALGISKLLQMGLRPENGPVVVTGATGGVGVWAVQMLSKLGFEVWAVSGKPESAARLIELGAQKTMGRDEIEAPIDKPLLRPRWAGAFDTVGGETLVALLKQCHKSGSVTTCGNVGGMKLEMTVFPFILNGVNLLGINAADTPMPKRKEVWSLLEKIAQPELVTPFGHEIRLEEIPDALEAMKKGQHTGRFTIVINE